MRYSPNKIIFLLKLRSTWLKTLQVHLLLMAFTLTLLRICMLIFQLRCRLISLQWFQIRMRKTWPLSPPLSLQMRPLTLSCLHSPLHLPILSIAPHQALIQARKSQTPLPSCTNTSNSNNSNFNSNNKCYQSLPPQMNTKLRC